MSVSSASQLVYRVPEGRRVYAVGDVHGRHDLLDQLARLIEADAQQSRNAGIEFEAIFLGDYIDRGIESRRVVERLASGDFPMPVRCLLGNHEMMMLSFLDAADAGDLWLLNGGLETLFSYGVDAQRMPPGTRLEKARTELIAALPAHHQRFLRRLELSAEIGDYFFCHAGVRPGVPLAQQRRDDLIWIREPFLSGETSFGKRIVHGHTPVMEADIRAHRINVDTGAYLTNRLTCAVLEEDTVRILQARA